MIYSVEYKLCQVLVEKLTGIYLTYVIGIKEEKYEESTFIAGKEKTWGDTFPI